LRAHGALRARARARRGRRGRGAGAGRALRAAARLLARGAEACDEHGALLIFDEIPTGLGKTGRFLACDHDGVVPDIVVMGKALGGGILPIAAAVCREGLDVAGDFAFGHYTHEKNPVTAAAALATLAVIDDEDLVAHTARVGAAALERMAGWKDRFPLVGDARGRGFLLGAELVKDRETREPANGAAERPLRALDKASFKTSIDACSPRRRS
jgi:4-aminobutyrate aminotransferase